MITRIENFTKAQEQVFIDCKAKYRIIQKGGRAGMTHGGWEAFIYYAFELKKKRMLWGDVSSKNAKRYFIQEAVPILARISKKGDLWDVNFGDGTARILNTHIDFRYSANPTNWEGFSYDVVFLNEAGIILDNAYIWEKAVLKMTIQYTDCIVLVAGVPKKQNIFIDLIERAKKEQEKGNPRWAFFQLTTYDNPFIPKQEIDEFVNEYPDVAAGEVFGEVTDESDQKFQYIPGEWVDQAFDRWDAHPPALTHAAIDPSLGGDTCVFAWRYNQWIPKMSSHTGAGVNDPGKVAAKFISEIQARMVKAQIPNFKFTDHLKRVEIGLDYQGPGSGVFSAIGHQLADMQGVKVGPGFDAPKFMDRLYPNIVKIYSSNKGDQWSYDKQWRLVGERMQMLDKVKALLDPTNPNPLRIERDPQLRREITAYCYEIMDGNRIRLEDKEQTKKRIGNKSPGQGDALMYLVSAKKKSDFHVSSF